MTEKPAARFIFSVIRYVPDPARGEFVNVGVVAVSDALSQWGMRRIADTARAEAFGDARSLGAATSMMDRLEKRIGDQSDTSIPENGEQWLWRKHRDHRNLVQFREPAPMSARNIDNALSRLYWTFLMDDTAGDAPSI